jgi:hypothetical protein
MAPRKSLDMHEIYVHTNRRARYRLGQTGVLELDLVHDASVNCAKTF